MNERVKTIRLLTYGPGKLFEITSHIACQAKEIKNGIIHVFSKGSTGALVIIPKDHVKNFERSLWDLLPVYGWEHPGNAYAHLRSTLIGTSLLILVKDREPLLPENHGVYFIENQPANRRERKIILITQEELSR